MGEPVFGPASLFLISHPCPLLSTNRAPVRQAGSRVAAIVISWVKRRTGGPKPASTEARDNFVMVMLGSTVGYSMSRLPVPLDERVFVGFMVIFTAGAWFKFLSWPRKKKRAGKLVVQLDRMPNNYAPAVFGIIFIVFATFILVDTLRSPNFPQWRVAVPLWFCFYSVSVMLIVVSVVGVQIRENGFLTFENFRGWGKIASYAWYSGTTPKLSLRIRRAVPWFFARSHRVSVAQRERVGEILEQYLGASDTAG